MQRFTTAFSGWKTSSSWPTDSDRAASTLVRGTGDGTTARNAFCNEVGLEALVALFDLVDEAGHAAASESSRDGSAATAPASCAGAAMLEPSEAKAIGKFSGQIFSSSCSLAIVLADDVVRDAACCSSAALAASTSLRLSSISFRRTFSDSCHAMLEHRMASDLPAEKRVNWTSQ